MLQKANIEYFYKICAIEAIISIGGFGQYPKAEPSSDTLRSKTDQPNPKTYRLDVSWGDASDSGVKFQVLSTSQEGIQGIELRTVAHVLAHLYHVSTYTGRRGEVEWGICKYDPEYTVQNKTRREAYIIILKQECQSICKPDEI